MARTIRDLSGDAIDSMPRDADWSEGYGETWESFEAAECEECGAVMVGFDSGCTHSEADEESECQGYVSRGEGPMMNYWYPLPEEPKDMDAAMRALVHLPLCIVRVGDEWGLALTGGGMDLSWEICAAFIALGYLPPIHFANLPQMAGRPRGRGDWFVVACCKASAKVEMKRAGYLLRNLRQRFSRVKVKA